MSRTLRALAPLAVLALSSCSIFEHQGSALKDVDDLLGRVERVQAECLLAQEVTYQAYDSLATLASPDFGGDAVEAYTRFAETLELAESRSGDLERATTRMDRSAEEVFAQWAGDLENFASPKMRRRSEKRLAATRKRFEAISEASAPAQLAFDEFFVLMNDYALYLSHDFNAAAVAEIREEVAALEGMVTDVERKLDACVAAGKDYVEQSALRGQLPPAQPEAGAAPQK
jgi:hypothetical protein